jgi:hypothetical protein
MSINKSHASHIGRVNVDFVLFGPDLEPTEVSVALGIQPDSSGRKGDERHAPNGKLIGHENEGWWRIDSTPRLKVTGIARKDINEHLAVLLDLLLPKKEILNQFRPKAEAFLGVVWTSCYLYAGTGPLIESKHLKGIAALGAGMGFDIYQVDEKEC